MNRKNVAILMAAVVAIALFSVRNPVESMLEIERQLTTSPYYDRNPSFFIGNDGTWWVFFARASSALPHVPPAYNPDADSYDIYYLRSTDAGVTWSAETALPSSTGHRGMAAFQDNTGKIWVFVGGFGGVNKNLQYFTSSDGGATWAGPTTVPGPITVNHMDAFQASDGKIWVFYESTDGSADAIYSSDYGTSWSAKIDVAGPNAGIPKVIQDASGNFNVVYIGAGGVGIYRTTSSTGMTGSWSIPSLIVSSGGGPVYDYDPVIRQDGGGNYWMFWAPWDQNTDSQWIEFVTSSDGTTWSSSTILTSGGYGATYWWDYWPEASLDPWGNILLFYTSERSSDGTTRTDGNIWMFRSPIPRYRADTNKPMMSRAKNTINDVKDLSSQADDLLKQAQDKGLDTADCEKIIDEAKELLELADKFFSGGNYIAANNFALKALDKYKDAVECLEELLG